MDEHGKEELGNCGDCRYYIDYGNEKEGQCRRHAPHAIATVESSPRNKGNVWWPEVQIDDGCWEFKRREPKRMTPAEIEAFKKICNIAFRGSS